ncbi:uncharacterized protein LOC114603496 [Podarcis muralis]
MPFVASGPFYRSTSILFSMINFLQLVIAHASPTWTSYIADVDHFVIGLWLLCSDKYGCQPTGTRDVSLNITRIFMILALIMSFVALALSMPWEWIVRCSSPFLSRPLLISIFSFIAAICSLTAVVVFGVQVDRKSDSAHPSGKIAFYLSCFTSAFSFLAAVYNGLVHKFSLWEVASSGRVEDTQKPDETA